MSAALPRIENAQARRLFLQRQGLAEAPGRKLRRAGLQDLIERLGFVQVDSINTLARAHDLILFSRNQTYRPKDLVHLLEREASLFENWTHDAALIPTRFFPHWRTRFEAERTRLLARWREFRRDGFEEMLGDVLTRVRDQGPVMARHLNEERDGEKDAGSSGWWDWHPAKTALEYHWRTGALAVARREGFQKVYDLTERVIPEPHRAEQPDRAVTVDWACATALERLGFATSGELAAFWGGVTPAEATAWCRRQKANGAIVEAETACSKTAKPRCVYIRPETLETLDDLPPAPGRLRALSPFDPLIRDRQRCERLFGFDYRIEVFVPAAKRRYGYYVFPLLEGERLIGRIDMKHQRQSNGDLAVAALWLEPKIKLGQGRRDALEGELERLRRFCGAERVTFADGWAKVGG